MHRAGHRRPPLATGRIPASTSLSPLQRGQSELEAGRSESALPHFERAARLAPLNPAPLRFLGFAHGLRSELKEAEHWFEAALELAPGDAETWFNLGNAQREQANHATVERALGSYMRALQLRPSWADAYINVGVAREALGDAPASLAAYTQALALAPRSMHALCNVAHASTWLGEWRGRESLLGLLRDRIRAATGTAGAAGGAAAGDRASAEDLRLIEPWHLLAYPLPGWMGRAVAEAHAAAALRSAASLPQLAGSRAPPGSARAAGSLRQLRLAYMSSDLDDAHPVGQLMSRVFGLHSRRYFHITCYSLGGAPGTGLVAGTIWGREASPHLRLLTVGSRPRYARPIRTICVRHILY